MAINFGQIVLATKVNGLMIKLMARVNLYTQMGMSMKVNG